MPHGERPNIDPVIKRRIFLRPRYETLQSLTMKQAPVSSGVHGGEKRRGEGKGDEGTAYGTGVALTT
jgi:hypothetical protein